MNAADITQRPESSGTYAINTVPVIEISTQETVTASIALAGESAFFTGTYIPDFNNEIHIDFADLYQGKLSTSVPTANNFTSSVNSSYRKMFVVTLQGTTGSAITIQYYVCNARFKSSTDFGTFTGSHFLTNQAVEKYTNYEAREFLAYLDHSGGTYVKARFYAADNTPTDVTVLTNATVGCVVMDVSYRRLMALAMIIPQNKKRYYDIMLYNGKDVLMAKQRYVYRESAGNEKYFCFVNALGGIDTLICQGANILAPETVHNIGRYGGNFVPVDDSDDYRTWEQKTGYFEHNLRNWVYELMMTKKDARKWNPDTEIWQEIVVTASEISASDEKRMTSATFRYILTDDSYVADESETPSNTVMHNPSIYSSDTMADTTEKEEMDVTAGTETEAVTVNSTKVFVSYITSARVTSEPVYYYLDGSATAAGSFVPDANGTPVEITITSGQSISFRTQNASVSKIIVGYY